MRLTRKYSSGPWVLPPPGAFCTHRRMKRKACEECVKRGTKVCRVECPDCGLTWMLFEGEFG